MSGAFHDRDSSSFKTSFKQHVIGLSFEIYNSFLPQLASKWRAVESGSPEKVPRKGAFYYINRTVFLDFDFWWLTISRPYEVKKSYISQKKALLPIVWKKFWNWANFCHEKLQTSFSRPYLKSTSFTKTHLEPSMAKILPISKLFSNNG